MATADRVRFDFRALHAALDRARRARGMSWQQAARDVGRIHASRISASTLAHTARGGPMEADGILMMLRWLGRTFRDFTAGDAPVAAAPTPEAGARTPRMRRFDARAFYTALDEQRRTRGLTWRQVAQELGDASPETLRRLARGGRMGVPGVVILGAWLGRPPETFTRATDE